MKRTVIKINEDLCDGCGSCVKGCHEGALQIIDGKARIVSDVLCDGMGDCIGECHAGAITFEEREAEAYDERKVQDQKSKLRQWPVQLHLLNPEAEYFQRADVVLAADCVAYTFADFHNRFLVGKTLAIACPKLDSNKESYVEKLTAMIDSSHINTLTVVLMEVPCCGGLMALAKAAVAQAKNKIPIKQIIISIHGKIMSEKWI